MVIHPSNEIVTQSLLELLTKAVQDGNKKMFFGLLKAVSEDRIWMLAQALLARLQR